MEKKLLLAFAATAMSCLTAGAVGGYVWAKYKLEVTYFTAANQEVAIAKEHYETKYKEKLALIEDHYHEKLLVLTADNLMSVEQEEHELNEAARKQRLPKLVMPEEMLQREVVDVAASVKYVTTTEEIPENVVTVKPKPTPPPGARLKAPVPVNPPTVGTQRERPIVNYRGAFQSGDNAPTKTEDKATDDPTDPNEPHDISEEVYYEGDDSYRQRQIKWYAADGVLTNIQDEPLEEAQTVVGDTLELFEEMDPEDNVLYVRNPKLMMDFEVIRIHGSFAEQVQGLGT
jgi:hypothetical protein